MNEHALGARRYAHARRHQDGRPLAATDVSGAYHRIGNVTAGREGLDADARLIAAAPDLLEALEEANRQLGDVAPCWSRKEYEQRIWRVGRLVRAALLKAQPDDS